ncbi:NAD(P)/FAD-dependent oxidoreductase [Streptomyces fuscigenes]|uniref:NAD(P)/FAD-dependent oxidoreductase n=1 Tax=Streptomyces fuscigenes TaxID=1528880 RepID=UPI001F17BC89|nr:FAD-dependent oxidoreductase [Streptomyces fuscigenes]MCF3960179.1 FAD-dependent oxidoreductase [Streptomyces fuscigenes]
MRRPRIAVVGAGMAAARFAERYGALGGTGTVTLYGAEAQRPYNRVLLADVLTGRLTPGDIALPTGAARTSTRAEVVAVATAAHTLALRGGATEEWDVLVLATGANPVLPPIRGVRRADGTGLARGVHALRSLADCVALAEDAARARRAVVIGGGVLGVGTSRALAVLGCEVEIVHQGPHLTERHLDADAAHVLGAGLAALGVESYTMNRARAVHCAAGTGRVSAVELASGYRLDCDLVVLACGVRPRTALAHAAGLAVRCGVVVDDTLATSAPDVYAIGDCAEHAGTVHGLSAPAWDQADALAARLSGTGPDTRYTGSRPLARLTAGPLEYAAFGEVDEAADPALDVLRLSDATRGSYKKLLLREERLVGAVLVGDVSTVDALADAYRLGRPVTDEPLHLLVAGG